MLAFLLHASPEMLDLIFLQWEGGKTIKTLEARCPLKNC
jgi:hypothetical protein